MTERPTARLSNQILDEATSWFVEFNEATQDERTREAFHEWLRTSPEHVRAFLQIAAHWEDDAPQPHAASESGAVESIDELLAMARLDTNIVPLMLKPEERRRVAHSDSSPSGGRPEAGKRSRRVAVPLAASVLITLASLSAWLITQRNVYSTGVGEQRSLRLEDGSTVEINARSRIAIRYSEHERHIELLDGQALFHVAKNKTRPFIVRSGPTQIQAVGTQFDVYRKKSGTVVTVLEGRVAVTSHSPANPSETAHPKQVSAEELSGAADHAEERQLEYLKSDSSDSPRSSGPSRESQPSIPARDEVFLAAGQQLTVSSTAAGLAQAADIAAATAWTQRRLIFARTPLSEVVEEFNRYNTTPLVITDPSIASTEISGTFSSSDPAVLLRFLREVGAYTVRETDSATQISSH